MMMRRVLLCIVVGVMRFETLIHDDDVLLLPIERGRTVLLLLLSVSSSFSIEQLSSVYVCCLKIFFF
jgi:hypothetical protein